MLGNVMLIDDDAFCNRMNAFVIEQHRAARSVVTFESAMEAMEHLERLVLEGRRDAFPDVILLDLHMSYMDGWGFLDRFGSLPPGYKGKTGIYILTSSIQAADREAAALHADVSGYIEKPFTTQELRYIAANLQTRILR